MSRPAPLALVALLMSLTAAGCQPAQAPQPAEVDAQAEQAAIAAAPSDAPEIPHDTTMAVAGVQPEAAFDTKALAGRFAGTLPCAGCPGLDATLTLDADGTFALDETRPGSSDPAASTRGTWAVEPQDVGHRLRLDPDSKDIDDRLFAIEASNQLRALSADGTAIAGDGALLSRQ